MGWQHTLEFTAQSEGQSRDMARQVVHETEPVPDVRVSGRLGFELVTSSIALALHLRDHVIAGGGTARLSSTWQGRALDDAARELAAEYNRCCQTGTLQGGVLAYDGDGPGNWFPADSLTGSPGELACRWLRCRYGGRLTVAGARELITSARS